MMGRKERTCKSPWAEFKRREEKLDHAVQGRADSGKGMSWFQYREAEALYRLEDELEEKFGPRPSEEPPRF